MTQQEVELLLKRYRLGLCSEEEIKAIEDWYENAYQKSDFSWTGDAKQNFKARLDDGIFERISVSKRIYFYQKPIFRVGIAAILAAFLISTFVWINNNRREKDWSNEPITSRYQNDVAPGKIGAEWTSNNSVFQLEGKNILQNKVAGIAQETDGALIFDSNAVTKTHFHNVIHTEKGQQYNIVLTDGSKIWLNASSTISFDLPFDKNTRMISLLGEAYFEVAHNKEKPFEVISSLDTITVLGTHFNINAYSDEPAYTATLLEGSIQYSSGSIAGVQKYLLNPEDQIVRSGTTIIQRRISDSENKIAWKDGYFSFSNDDIATVMRQLERWYNIKVIYRNENHKERFYGDLRKDAPLTSILSVLEKSGVKFLLQGTKVTVL